MDAVAINVRAVDAAVQARTRARWRKVRAATLVFVLFRRRASHGASTARHGRQTKRMPTSVFFAKSSVQVATTSAAQRLSALPTAAASPQVIRWYAQKLRWFERLTRKPIQNRSDIDVKILAEFIRNTKFFLGLTSASIDALAQRLRFRTCHEGEVLHRQGSEIHDTSGRYLVVDGSLMVYKNEQYALRATEKEDYDLWFLSNNPITSRDSVRYGDCIDTCSAGDTTGDAISSARILSSPKSRQVHLSRKKLLADSGIPANSWRWMPAIAYVTRADYKRVIRFNIEDETHVVDAVREILTPAKPTQQDMRQLRPLTKDSLGHSAPPAAAQINRSPQQNRVLVRFLGRFQCFRILPHQFCMDLLPKLQLCTVKSDDVVCAPNDEKPSMVMVLDGKLCVHADESCEAKFLASLDDRDAGVRPPSPPKRAAVEPKEYLPGCEAGAVVEASVGTKSLHVCSLTAGESYGEFTIADSDRQSLGAIIYHPFASTGQTSATFVRLYRHDYEATLQRYVDSVDFNLDSVSTILSHTLPQDRTDEQVYLIKIFLLRRSSAKLFFSQIPSRTLDTVLLHAYVERYDAHEDIEEIIQREDKPVESMKIILNGYVGVFKGSPVAPRQPRHDEGLVVLKRPVLRRNHSRLIRANTHILDTGAGKPTSRPASVARNIPAFSRPGLPELREDATVNYAPIDPVSILPSGAAFGHLQILTGRSKSPYSYAAFAPGSGTTHDDSSRDPRRDDPPCIQLLVVPAEIVLLCLTSLNEQIVNNPIRALKRLQHESVTMLRNRVSPAPLIRRLHLSLLLSRNSVFKGIPRQIVGSMMEGMRIVTIEPRRLICELGASVRREFFVVLSGSVRVFFYTTKTKTGRDRERRGSSLPVDDMRPKLPHRISQEPSESKGHEWLSDAGIHHSFEKPAGDWVFLSDYDQTVELGSGDCFGRHDSVSLSTPRVRGLSSSALSNRSLRSHSSFTENVVSMTECLIGVIARKETTCDLSIDARLQLARMIDDREDSVRTAAATGDQDIQKASSMPSFNSLAASFRVLEAMDLAHRLTTHQRVHVANCLKYRRLYPGETVYRQEEEGEAIYYVLFGFVTLFTRSNCESKLDARSRGRLSMDYGRQLLDVVEGEVFGEEVFQNSHGSTRSCTAVATADDDQATELVYLTRSDYDQIVEGAIVSHKGPARGSDSKNETTLQLLGLGKKSITARERWRMAIYQVLQLRAQRSQWPMVLTKARNHRIDLLLDLVKDLCAFDGTPLSSIKAFCSNAELLSVGIETTIYSKSERVVDACFLVVQGAVELHQSYFGSSAPVPVAASVPAGYLQPAESSGVRVHIQTVCAGGIFGEFEMLEERPRRHIHATVAQPGTKLVIVQQADYFAYWPKREQMESKLLLLKNQLQKSCRLDSDQLCSLYYGMCERTFRRNEVMSGTKEHVGFLHVIQSGMCVVHDTVVLKKREKDSGKPDSPTKLSLDTRVSTLGPGVVLFAEKKDTPLSIDNRRASSHSFENVETAIPPEPAPTQYIVADSPTVSTLSVQLFPKSLVSHHHHPDLLVLLLLGKSGLQTIRETMNMQLRWRADNVAQTSRQIANAFSQPADPVARFASSSSNAMQRSRLTQSAVQTDIPIAVLRNDHNLQQESMRSTASPRKQAPLTPRFDYEGLTSMPRKPGLGSTYGSFYSAICTAKSQSPVHIRSLASPKTPTLPSLRSISTLNTAQSSPRSQKLATVSNLLVNSDEQLRKEERVLTLIQKPTPREDISKTRSQQQMRRRHGRPATKHVDNNYLFVDERAMSPSRAYEITTNRRKKNGFAGGCFS